MLRDERDGVLPETTGASKLNKSDVFFGDGTIISREVCVCVRACACVCVSVCVYVYVCMCVRVSGKREKNRGASMLNTLCWSRREVGGWGRVPFSKNLMSPTPRRKWYLTTGRRAH